MASRVIELLSENYDEKFGVVNLRSVLDELSLVSQHPFNDISVSFEHAEPRWQPSILEAMRVLAISNGCSKDEAWEILRATTVVASDIGNEEYFKSVNALVTSTNASDALAEFIAELLAQRPDDFRRRLAFYVVGMLIEHGMTEFHKDILSALRYAAAVENSLQSRQQMEELLGRLPETMRGEAYSGETEPA